MQKKFLAIAVAHALALPVAAHAVSYKISGHVNRAVLFADDGTESEVMHVDGSASPSRITLAASDNLGVGGLKVGALLEWDMSSNSGNKVTINGANGNDKVTDDAFTIRHSHIWFSGSFGRLTIGHGSVSTDGIMFAGDQSGSVALAGIENGVDFGGDIQWRTNTGGRIANAQGTGNLSVDGAFSTYDGGREDVVRYDTPQFGPVSAAVSVGDDKQWSVAGRLSTSFSGASIGAAIGYEHQDDNDEIWGGSIGILFSQGTNLHFSYAENDQNGGNNSENLYIKLGHRWGNNSVAIDYGETDDNNLNGDEATTWGIGFAHDIPGPNVQLYTGYKNFDLDRTGANVEDVDLFVAGARVRF